MPARARPTALPAVSSDPLVELERLGRRIQELPPLQRGRYLASLPAHKQRTAEYALGVCNLHWRADPSTMMARLSRTFKRWRYIALLGAAFRRAADGIEPRQIWMLPARYGKSNLASQWGPAWLLDRDPTSKIILASYGYELARENAVNARDILNEHRAELRVRLRADRRRQDRYVTTGGGGLLAAGVGGSMTGFGAGGGLIGSGGGVILDDLFKGWPQAHSAAERDRVWNWYRSVVRLRLNTENTFIIHVTTRWHIDDVVGRMIAAELAGDGDSWTVYRIPALAEAPTPKYPEPDLLGRQPGEALEPLRFTVADIASRQRALGCTPAETPIVMADWTVKPISEVVVGDVVLGWENIEGHKQRWQPAVVEATTAKPGVVLDYRMESGRTIRATRDHRWLRRADRPYTPANVGSPLRHLVEVDEPELTPRQRDLWQYLAGIVDGEGSIGDRRSLSIVQTHGKNTPVVERILATLDELGLVYSTTIQQPAVAHHMPRVMIEVNQSGAIYRRLVRDTLLAKRDQAIGALYAGAGRSERSKDRVVSIERPVSETVYALQTSTGNYVAWGYGSSNSYLTAGMEQQRPAPEEGGELKRAWWQWGDLPTGRPDEAISSWDMKLKDKKGGDFVVGQAWHRYASTAWCVEQLRGQWNLVTTRAAIALMQVRHPNIGRHLVENTGNGPEVIAALREGIERATIDDSTAGELGMRADERDAVEALLRKGMAGIIPVTPKGDKVARARAVSGYLEAGDVWLPNTAANGWGAQLVDEAASFPTGDHDDQVDAWSQAMAVLLSTAGQGTMTKARGQIRLPTPGHVGPRTPRR